MKIFILVLIIWTMVCGAASALERPPMPVEKPSGSGVIVHQDGYVLTAHHVVSNAKRIIVVTPGEFRAPAVLVSADPEHDLALLKVETVGLTEALEMEAQAQAICMGHPDYREAYEAFVAKRPPRFNRTS